jgi:hypothetical protein
MEPNQKKKREQLSVEDQEEALVAIHDMLAESPAMSRKSISTGRRILRRV